MSTLQAETELRLGSPPVRRSWNSGCALDGETLFDRFHFEPGPNLGGNLHPGQAIGASTWRYRAISTPLVFAADTTSYVWLLATGKPPGHRESGSIGEAKEVPSMII